MRPVTAVCANLPVRNRLLVAQRLNRIQAGSSDCGHYAAYQPDRGEDEGGDQQRGRINEQADVAGPAGWAAVAKSP
ncbi:MAG: hypothetical protein ABSG52_16655 [Terriglobales bacterium]